MIKSDLYKPGTSIVEIINDGWREGYSIDKVSRELALQEFYLPYELLVEYFTLLTYRKEHPHDNG